MVGGEEERDQSQELTNEQPPIKKRRLVEPETMVNFNTGMLCVHTHTHTGTHAHTHSLPTHTQAHTHTASPHTHTGTHAHTASPHTQAHTHTQPPHTHRHTRTHSLPTHTGTHAHTASPHTHRHTCTYQCLITWSCPLLHAGVSHIDQYACERFQIAGNCWDFLTSDPTYREGE